MTPRVRYPDPYVAQVELSWNWMRLPPQVRRNPAILDVPARRLSGWASETKLHAKVLSTASPLSRWLPDNLARYQIPAPDEIAPLRPIHARWGDARALVPVYGSVQLSDLWSVRSQRLPAVRGLAYASWTSKDENKILHGPSIAIFRPTRGVGEIWFPGLAAALPAKGWAVLGCPPPGFAQPGVFFVCTSTLEAAVENAWGALYRVLMQKVHPSPQGADLPISTLRDDLGLR